MAATRPGGLVVVGAPWSGSSRFADELAARLAEDGAIVVRPRGVGDLAERLSRGLQDADLRPDPVTSAALHPFAALAGDIDEDAATFAEIGAALRGTPGLLIGCAHEIPGTAAYVELAPLSDETAEALALDAAPQIPDLQLAATLALAAGRPGVIVPLARAARRSATGTRARITLPAALRLPFDARLKALPREALDLMQWAAVLGPGFAPDLLAEVARRPVCDCAELIDMLVVDGLLAESGELGDIRLSVTDPLLAEIVRQGTPPGELRHRNTTVLAARRNRGDGPQELVPYAVGSANLDEVVALSIRAAQLARERGNHRDSLEHADRALSWIGRQGRTQEFLDASLQRGLALAGLGRWSEATQTLEDVVRRQRRAGDEAAALRAITEWARMRWYAGYRQEAFDLVTANLPTREGSALPARAEMFTQAAHFATRMGDHTQSLRWSRQARDEALAAGDRGTAITALNAMIVAEVRSTASPEPLEGFRRALAEANEVDNPRQAAITLANEGFCLLGLGYPQRAADRSQEGLDIVEARKVGELDAPLGHNLAEALAWIGRLRQARRVAGRSRDAYEGLGSRTVAHIDSLIAWIDFCEGKIADALSTLRAIAHDAAQDQALNLEHIDFQMAFHVHVAHAAGEQQEAQRIARDGIAYWSDTDDRMDAICLLGAACEVLPVSESKAARADLARAAEAGSPLARALGLAADAWHARAAAAAAEAFRTAGEAFAEAGYGWWATRCRMLAGERAPKDEGIEDLLEARKAFREMEAPGWRSKCEAELRKRGHKFVMASRHTEDAGLTEREVEILQLVAQGLTNREMAERLYISDKTAGRHLERIFAKLRVNSRAAAVTAAVELGIVSEPADHVSEPEGGNPSGAFNGLKNDTTVTAK